MAPYNPPSAHYSQFDVSAYNEDDPKSKEFVKD